MKLLIYYLLQVIVTSAILYGYYHIALRNKQFHRYNRFYLLAASVISVIIPFFNIPVYFTQTQTDSSFVLHTLSVISSAGGEEIMSPVGQPTHYSSWFTVQNILLLFYLLAAFIALLRILFSLTRIRRIIHANPVERLDKIHFVTTDEPNTPFSFFRWLFWNKKIELHSEKGEQIFRHELFHIRQKHSWDIMYMELLTVILWINPFFHLMKKEIKAIHEFLADEFAIKENKKWEYAELLLMQAFQTNHHLVNPFFHNQIKRRIAMITKSQKPSYRYLRKMMVLPLAAIAAALFAFSYKNKKEKDQLPGAGKPITAVIDAGHGGTDAGATSAGKPITVVIDAGHGGADAGATAADGTLEKDIVLTIAQKVRLLNEDDQINIILTRDGDLFPDLKARTEIANTKKADLFLSLHLNNSSVPGTGNDKTGFEVYISKKNKSFYSENRVLGSILLNYFSFLYPVNKAIKQAESSIYVLENSPCPAALIECGYMNNSKDMEFMKDPANQEKIAKAILETIDQYAMQKKSADWEERKQSVIDTVSSLRKLARSSAVGHTTGYVEVVGSKNAISFVADSIVFTSDPEKLETDVKTALYVVNGEKKESAFFFGKLITAKTITVYPTDDEYAIKKYGPEAKNGVIVFENAKTEPMIREVADTTRPDKTDNITFDKVEIEPSFPGGEAKWRQYLERNLDASVPAKGRVPDGAYTVVVQFIVDKEGNITNVKSLTKHGYGMEEEAMRVIKKGPKWTPAVQNGLLVRAYKKQPITFIVGKGEKNFPGHVKASGNELNEKIVTGYNVNQNLYEKVATGYKMKQDLNEKVATGYKMKQDLNEKVVTGYNMKQDLNEKVVTGYKMNQDLNEKVATGYKMNQDLNEKVVTGYNMKQDLNEKVVTGYNMKQDLNEKVVTGYNMKQDLNEKVVTGYNMNQDLYEKVVTGYPVTQNSNEPVFTKTEIEASFPGGENAFKRYVSAQQTNLLSKYGVGAVSGNVVVEFIVAADGTISDIKALDGAGESGYGKAAVELIRKGPKWNPGMQNGRVVKSYKKQTVTFIMP